MIIANNINKKFGELEVLKNISLDIKRGEIVSIIGPSGAGKTTLLQIIGTLEKPDSGIIKFNNEIISNFNENEVSAFRNKHIGFVFQFHQLLPEFSAIENVMIPALIAKKDKKESFSNALDLLSFLGLKDRINHKPNELSGGEKQRVAIARALINNPDVILADEPSGSLDSKNKLEIHRLFMELREKLNQTLIIVTHDKELAEISDRVIKMEDGKIIQ